MASQVRNETEIARTTGAISIPTAQNTSVTSSRWIAPTLLALAIVATLLMRLSTLHLPLERDEGAYATIASLWMQGHLPYRDAFDHKPPLLYLLYMPPLLWGGADAVAIRVWASLVFLFQLPLVYLIGRIVWTSTTAALAALIYAIVGSAFKLQGLMFNTEQALMLPALIGLWTLIHGIAEERLRWPLAYGLCLGLVSLIKPTAVPLLVPLVLLVRAGRPYAYIRNAGAMVVGMLLPWLPVMLIWGVASALPELVFALATYNRIYAEESLQNWDGGGVVNVVAPLGALLVYAAGGVALAGWLTLRQRQRLALSLWTVAFIAAAILSLRGYIHYYYPALPGLALLAAPVLTRLLHRRAGNSQLWGGIAAALLAAVLLIPFVRDAVEVSRLNGTQQATRLYGDDGTHYFATAPAVAAYIRSVTTPEEPIFVWASEPEIYLLANRRPSSRYIYTYPLDLIPASRMQLEADLQHDPPAVVVLYHGLQPASFTELALQRNMRLVTQIGGFDIWLTPNDAR